MEPDPTSKPVRLMFLLEIDPALCRLPVEGIRCMRSHIGRWSRD